MMKWKRWIWWPWDQAKRFWGVLVEHWLINVVTYFSNIWYHATYYYIVNSLNHQQICYIKCIYTYSLLLLAKLHEFKSCSVSCTLKLVPALFTTLWETNFCLTRLVWNWNRSCSACSCEVHNTKDSIYCKSFHLKVIVQLLVETNLWNQ